MKQGTRRKVLEWFAWQKRTYAVCPVIEIAKATQQKRDGNVDVSIQSLFEDGLLTWYPGGWRITEKGRAALAE